MHEQPAPHVALVHVLEAGHRDGAEIDARPAFGLDGDVELVRIRLEVRRRFVNLGERIPFVAHGIQQALAGGDDLRGDGRRARGEIEFRPRLRRYRRRPT